VVVGGLEVAGAELGPVAQDEQQVLAVAVLQPRGPLALVIALEPQPLGPVADPAGTQQVVL